MASLLPARPLVCLLALGASACRQDLCPAAPSPFGQLRLSARCASIYRPPALKGTVVGQPPYEEMLALQERGAWAELGAAWFLHGMPEQAAFELEQIAQPDDRDSDLAAVAFARGDAGQALERLDAVLERRPDHPLALWNRGVVLSLMEPHLPLLAAESFQRVADRKEPGWAEDARARAAALRSETAARQEEWTAAHQALQDFSKDSSRPLPAEAVARFPGMAREVLENALRQAPDRDHARALLPLAEALDRASGGTFLHDRALGLVPERDDPWWQLEADIDQAKQRFKDGDSVAGSGLLERVLQRCRPAGLPYLCLLALRELSVGANSANQVSLAEQRAQEHWREALALGEWGQETLALRSLAQADRFQIHLARARAVLGGYLERTHNCSYVQRNLAALDIQDLRFRRARSEIAAAVQCGEPIGLNGAAAIAELARVSHDPKDAQNLDEGVKAEKASDFSKGRKCMEPLVRGMFKILTDREAGRNLLWEAIRSCNGLREKEPSARDGWSAAYRELVLDAVQRGEFQPALSLMARRLQVGEPKRCALLALVGGERTAVVAAGPDGRLSGRYRADRQRPLGASLEGLVPPDLVARVEACPRVDVLAMAPLDTRSRLLPSRIAWAYGVGKAPARATPRSPRHLVISDVAAPDWLHLERLSAWSAAGEVETLSGSDATPANVLQAMAGATAIEIHAHGRIDPVLSGATSIALAPEPGGRFALTAERVGHEANLGGAPVVILAACAAAWRPAFLHETGSLPQAFIARGARAVLAPTVDVPDREAGRFFTKVSERIQQGGDPAVVLREEREAWLAKRLGGAWVNDVLLYQ